MDDESLFNRKIPHEVIFYILQFASNKTLLITVCKYWTNIINSLSITINIEPGKYFEKCVARGYIPECEWAKSYNCIAYTDICRIAIHNENINMLKWLKKSGNDLGKYKYIIAASKGNLEILKWLKENNTNSDYYNTDICSYAALHGHLDVLKWARENGCRWCYETCTFAAKNGHFNVLKWARENGCNWDQYTGSMAAENNHFAILKWLNGFGYNYTEYTCACAVKSGNFEMVKWLRNNGCPWNWRACAYAAYTGNLEILKWLRTYDCPWDENACAYAAGKGHLDILKWARNNGCAFDSDACAYAAGGGHFEILKWLRAHDCPWDSRTCAYAAGGGHFEILKWCRDKSIHGDYGICKWNYKTIEFIIRKNIPIRGSSVVDINMLVGMINKSYSSKYEKLEILKWCRDKAIHGEDVCNWNKAVLRYHSEDGKDNLHMLKWCRDRSIHGEDVCNWNANLYKNSKFERNIKALKWVISAGCPLNASVCSYTADKGCLEMLKCLRNKEEYGENICPWSKYTCKNAKTREHYRILEWIKISDNDPCDGEYH